MGKFGGRISTDYLGICNENDWGRWGGYVGINVNKIGKIKQSQLIENSELKCLNMAG